MVSVRNAQRIIEDYNYLIGEDYNGMTIEALIITPQDAPEFKRAIDQYARTYDSSLIYPASNVNGYTVTAILDQERSDAGALLSHAGIFHIISSKGIEIDYRDYGIEL